MHRIIYPTHLAAQIKLLEDIKAKHDSDGATSLLTPYLIQHNIDLNHCIAQANIANVENNKQIDYHKQVENVNQLKKLQSNTAIANLKNEVQFLKKLYPSNPKQLGNWGIAIVGKGQVKYPQNFVELMNIATNFFKKHLDFPAGTSPLQPFINKNNIDVVANNVAVLAALQTANLAQQNGEQAAIATQNRNLLWQSIFKNVKGIGNYLKNLYQNNPNGLGNYGFLIVTSSRKPQVITSKILLGQHKTIKSVIVGSTLTNTGNVTVKIYKGRQVKGEFIELTPQQSLEIAKGYSIMTILNDNLLQTAYISAQRSI